MGIGAPVKSSGSVLHRHHRKCGMDGCQAKRSFHFRRPNQILISDVPAGHPAARDTSFRLCRAPDAHHPRLGAAGPQFLAFFLHHSGFIIHNSACGLRFLCENFCRCLLSILELSSCTSRPRHRSNLPVRSPQKGRTGPSASLPCFKRTHFADAPRVSDRIGRQEQQACVVNGM